MVRIESGRPMEVGDAVEVSVVVPALNEAGNLPRLVPQIAAALTGAGKTFEIIVVDDDSRDETPAVAAELATQYPLRLIVRKNPRHGLSGAVLHGIAASTGRRIVVMDADLQHPPAALPALLAALDSGADFALGSRYVSGGSTDARWTLFRRINSGVATALARPFAGAVADPMSGFFALDRTTFNRADRLTPLGYKIALELICKCRVNRVQEVPIHFGMRVSGQSKLSLKQQFKYLEHLSRLYDFTFPRGSPIGKFLIATAAGLIVAVCAFARLREGGVGPVMATAIAYAGSVLMTAVFHLRYVRTQREFLVNRRPWADFVIVSTVEWVSALLAMRWLDAHTVGESDFGLFFISFGVAMVIRYVLRKEFLQDVRGLRRNLRSEELIDPPSAAV